MIASLSFSHSIFAEQPDKADIDLSHKIVKQFMGKLKGELMTAMKAGGPINALQVCNTKAVVITQNVSNEHKMDIGRTSLKLRNPINTADFLNWSL